MSVFWLPFDKEEERAGGDAAQLMSPPAPEGAPHAAEEGSPLLQWMSL